MTYFNFTAKIQQFSGRIPKSRKQQNPRYQPIRTNIKKRDKKVCDLNN